MLRFFLEAVGGGIPRTRMARGLSVRCFFLRDGRIRAVHILDEDSDDGLIEQARKKFFAEGGRSVADGFEVWHGARFIFRFPPDLLTPKSSKQH